LELEMRTLRRTCTQLESQLSPVKWRLRRLCDGGWEGTPFPSRIQAYYARLRALLAERQALVGQYLGAVYVYNGKRLALAASRGFDSPCTAWVEAIAKGLDDLVATLDAQAAAADDAYAADVKALEAEEAKDVATFQIVMNEYYGESVAS
jgi:hypothetical protein